MTGLSGDVVSGTAVGGSTEEGAAIYGWCGAPDTENTVDQGSLPHGSHVGVYGCYATTVSDVTSVPVPTVETATCGVWGDIPASGVTGSGVLGTNSGAGAGVSGLSVSGPGGTFTSQGSSPGVFGTSVSGPGGAFTGQGLAPGVHGQGTDAEGGVFGSASGAQLKLVPSTTPLDDNNPLIQTGQPGDLYLYLETRNFPVRAGLPQSRAILWLCTASQAETGNQALWAQVVLGDTVGG